MILPTKGLAADRCLLEVGAEVLNLLDRPASISQLWSDLRRYRMGLHASSPVTYDWYVLALDMLFTIGAVAYEGGLLRTAWAGASKPGGAAK